MSRRTVGVVLAVLLALAGTTVLTMYVRSADARAREGQQLVEVLVVTQEVPAGTPALDLARALERRAVPAEAVALQAVDDLEPYIDDVTAVALLPGEQLQSPRLIDPQELATQSRVEIPEGMQEVTVQLDAARAVGGRLRPGDLVGVFASFDGVDTEETTISSDGEAITVSSTSTPTTQLILHHVLVTNVQSAQVSTAAPPIESAEEPATLEPIPAATLLVTLAVPAADAERVVFTAEHGAVWLSDEPIEATAGSGGVVTEGNVYR